MFRSNEKTVRKIIALNSLQTEAEYNKQTKSFRVLTNQINYDFGKRLNKLGLRIISVKKLDYNLELELKRKSNLSGIIIGLLGFQVILFSFQILYLASKTNLP